MVDLILVILSLITTFDAPVPRVPYAERGPLVGAALIRCPVLKQFRPSSHYLPCRLLISSFGLPPLPSRPSCFFVSRSPGFGPIRLCGV